MTDAQDTTDEQESLVKTSVSLPRYLYDWMRDTAKRTEFNSQSAVMVVALSELKGRMDERAEHDTRKETPTIPARESDDSFAALLLQLLNNHQDLVEEVNTLRKKQRGAEGNHKRVTFE